LTAWALSVCAIFGVLVAFSSGGSVHRQQLERARQEAKQWRPVVLVVTQATPAVPSLQGRGVAVTAPVAVSWQGSDQRQHRGVARLYGPYRVGETAPGWVDQAERLMSGAPTSPFDALLAAFWCTVAILIGEGCALALVWRLVTRATMARNCESWAWEWATVEPVWSGREPHRSEDAGGSG
jgi:hypothetical protein